MKLLKPFSLSQKSQSDRSYFLHRSQMRFLNLIGVGIQRVADDHARKIIAAQREVGDQITESLDKGFAGVQANQLKIHGALLDQTEVIREGLATVNTNLEVGFGQVNRGLIEVVNRVDHVGEVIVEQGDRLFNGIAGLKASFDMGMTNVVSQFELQREELKQGLTQLSDLMKNQRKTEARERFLDGKLSYERYLAHPEEPQFLSDAHDYLQESIAIFRGNPFSHLYLGHIHQEPARHFDLELAQKHYQFCATYAKGIPNHSLAGLGYFLAAWIAFVRGEVKSAIDLGERAREFDPEGLPENYYNLAKYYAYQQSPTEALQHLDKAVRTFDPLYTLKADIDEDFMPIRAELDRYFLHLRDEAAREWEANMQSLGLPNPK